MHAHTDVGSLFTNGQQKNVTGCFVTFWTLYASFDHDVIDTDCRTQNGSTHGQIKFRDAQTSIVNFNKQNEKKKKKKKKKEWERGELSILHSLPVARARDFSLPSFPFKLPFAKHAKSAALKRHSEMEARFVLRSTRTLTRIPVARSMCCCPSFLKARTNI